MDRKDLGEQSDASAIDALIGVAGLKLVDVGCGAGKLSRELAARGATVLGVEPDPVQAEKNRRAEPVAGLTFAEAGAEALPVADASVDGVIFCRSLHHVPERHMAAALREAARVLRPGGFLWVVEPAMDGSYFPVMRPFHDETAVRTAAQAALRDTAAPLFRSLDAYRWLIHPRFRDFGEMVALVTGMTFNDIDRADVETAEVRDLFEKGRDPAGGYTFEQPMLANLYREPVAA